MSWLIVLKKGLKYFVVVLAMTILASITPDVIKHALEQLPFAAFWTPTVVPVLSGLVGAALNAVKHWND